MGAEEDTGGLLAGLTEVLAKIKELETSAKAAPKEEKKLSPEAAAKVDEMVKTFQKSMSTPGPALEEDELHACALMAARRYSTDEVATLLKRFVDTSDPLTAGEASKTTMFKSI